MKTHGPSKSSLVWTLCSSVAPGNGDGNLPSHKMAPRLFPWKRSYRKSFNLNASNQRNSSSSIVRHVVHELFYSHISDCFIFNQRLLFVSTIGNSNVFFNRKLLLLRNRNTVYKRSKHGFSLRKSKVLSVGSFSLKWSKSIEKHSKKANEVCLKLDNDIYVGFNFCFHLKSPIYSF